MSYLSLGQFDQAITAFETYLNNKAYSVRRFAADASYRLGVALYGAGRFADAESAFRRFLSAYPESDLISEAYSMTGDIRGADGDLSAALDLYSKAIESASSMEQINYAVFQTAAVYELQKKYENIVTLMEGYLTGHGEKGNYAGAGFWMGKAYNAMGRKDKALETYIETIVRFGDKPENDEVDLILRELVRQHDSKESWGADESAIKTRLNSELRKAENQSKTTLALRIGTLFTYLTKGSERDQYVNKILSEENVRSAGPLTLLLMAAEAERTGNAGLVHKAFQRCMETCSESEIVVDVMNTELKMLFKEGRYREVIGLAEEITSRFGYRAEVGLTRKLKADAFRLTGQYDDAVKTYQELFAVREWRGPLTPESLYWIGICRYEQGKTEEAFAFFQRVYVLYGSYTEWVAKAYEGSLLCLERMGKSDEVIRTCREMLANEAVAAAPEGQRARVRLSQMMPQGSAR
jgi:TolA-binding protein